jgi:hypothetical protein
MMTEKPSIPMPGMEDNNKECNKILVEEVNKEIVRPSIKIPRNYDRRCLMLNRVQERSDE